MLNLEIDGRPVEVPNGSTVMDAANKLGVYVPHFCYHQKLSIAANCRMCLVQVEKAPKPLPACATPATDGMKVWTHSEQAVKAQKGVMEFLLINHPLDCPICDQGGECQLQDLAVGYGASGSRYTEAKRVVFHKNLGPLVSAEEMTRCIHCTRCVRFGQEIAGVMELGMAGRGEHSEIVSFVGRSVDSELSGNMIDLCPVGALTSKPFRYAARTWELSRRKSVSPHDSLGSNLVVQVKGDRVMRVLPLENEAVNECWLSDKDRFSYEALNGDERLDRPMIKRDGEWREVDWQSALEFVAARLAEIVARDGGEALGTLVSPHATLEEMALAAQLTRALGCRNVDFRLRQSDFRGDGRGAGIPWLGLPVAALDALDRALVVGSFLRKDHPLVAQRLRQAAKKGAQVSMLHSVADDWLLPVAHSFVASPSLLPHALAEIVVAAARGAGQPVPAALAAIEPTAGAQVIAASLLTGERKAILLGNFAEQHREASQLLALAQALARITGATLGCLGEAANSVGGHVAGALPRPGGLDARAMLASPRKAYLLLHAEAEFDCANPGRRAGRAGAGRIRRRADPVPPRHPVRRRAAAGRAVHRDRRHLRQLRGPRADASTAWSSRAARRGRRGRCCACSARCWACTASRSTRSTRCGRRCCRTPPRSPSRLANGTGVAIETAASAAAGLERVADVPIHFADPLVRRAPSLQQTADSRPPRARMNAADAGAHRRRRRRAGHACARAAARRC